MALRLLDTKTRFIDQDTFGLDKNTAVWGWLKYFLDQTLVEGTTPIDVVSISIREEDLYWLFDLVLAEVSGYKANLSVVEVSNSTIPILNKIHRVQEIKDNGNTITLAVLKEDLPLKPSDIPDALGTKVKLAPLGYKKTFEEGLKVVYESANPENKRCYLRVDNGCPVGHDPAMVKFARVSMFSDIRYIDDYEFRLGRVKAPAEADNYTVCETSVKYVWPHTVSASLNDKLNIPWTKFFIVGDDKTFYIYIKHPSYWYYEAKCFLFGEYSKILYKEDPLPFLLYAPKYENLTNTDDVYYNLFTDPRENSHHVMGQAFNKNFSKKASESFSLPETLTGVYSDIPFIVYENEAPLNPTEFTVITKRNPGSVLEGSLRGLKRLLVDIPPETKYSPKDMQILIDNSFYIFVGQSVNSSYYYSFLISLGDWNELV